MYQVLQSGLFAISRVDESVSFLFCVGPRFVLQLIKVFEGSFGGPTLYENPHYITPNAVSSYIRNRLVVCISGDEAVYEDMARGRVSQLQSSLCVALAVPPKRDKCTPCRALVHQD